MKFSFGLDKKNNSNFDSPFEESFGLDSSGGELVRGLSELYMPEDDEPEPVSEAVVEREVKPKDIVDILCEMGSLTEEQNAKIRSRGWADDLVEALLSSGYVTVEAVMQGKAKLYGLEFIHIDCEEIEHSAFAKLDPEFIKDNRIVPIAIDGDVLVAATSEPENVITIEEVKQQTGMDIRLLVCCPDDIKHACEHFESSDDEYCVDEILSDMTDVEVVQDEEDESEDLEKMAGESPVIKFVNYLISNAIREGASDIHIEPKSKQTLVRYRIDGALFESMRAPSKMHQAVVSRIKIMANLDISERRVPQDGKIAAIVSRRNIDLRVSTLPTNYGEKVVIRILDSRSIMRGLDGLGMTDHMRDAFQHQVQLPNGIFLVTGPTGSGKSTTLYSALALVDGESLNVSTVEDPVEYQLDFCNQVQVRQDIGLTFSAALRSLLRQDPDIIMVGEIRDGETAKIAVQAALTGHLVLSTLHTNDAPSSITRLVNLGIEPYLLAASINGVLAQRLVRKVCPKCKESYNPTERLKEYLEQSGIGKDSWVHGAGCENCRNSGYSGRVGIYEMLVIDDDFRKMINADSSVAAMRQAFKENCGKTLLTDGLEKVKQGLTTIEEVLRVSHM